MKKLLLSLAAVAAMSVPAMAESVVFTWSEMGYENAQDVTKVEEAPVTISFANGTNSNGTKYYNTGTALRFYAGNEMTVSVADGYVLEDFEITLGADKFNDGTKVNNGTFTEDGNTASWIPEGNVSTVTLTNGGTKGHAKMTSMIVSYKEGEATDNPSDDQPGDDQPATPADVISVAEAIAMIQAGSTATVQVKGYISYIKEVSTQFGNATYDIVDELNSNETPLTVYRGKWLNGAAFTAENQIAIGGLVVVEGTLQDYQGTMELSTGNKLISYVAPEGGDTPDPDQPDDPDPDQPTPDDPIAPGETITETLVITDFYADSEATNSYNSKVYTSTATGITYSAQLAKASEDNGGGFQIRTNNNNSGIVVTANPYGYVIKSIEVAPFGMNNDGEIARTVDVYGNTAAYSSPADLYVAATSGVKLASLSKATNETEAEFDENYAFWGLRSANAACYFPSITIVYEMPEGGDVPTPDVPVTKVIYSGLSTEASYEQMIVENVEMPAELDYVWQWDNQYGAKASAYVDGTRYVTEARLITEEISLEGYKDCQASFSHAANYTNALTQELLKVYVAKVDGLWEEASVSAWPEGNNWTFVDATIDLSAYDGNTIQICYCYTSTETVAPTWEVRNLNVIGTEDTSSAVEEVEIADDAEAVYYNLQGVKVNNPEKGIYIKVVGNKAVKVVK